MIIFIYLKVQVLVRMIIFIACGGRKSNLSGGAWDHLYTTTSIEYLDILMLFDAFFLATILQDCISPVKRQCLNDEQRVRPFLGFRIDGGLLSLELSHYRIIHKTVTKIPSYLHVFV